LPLFEPGEITLLNPEKLPVGISVSYFRPVKKKGTRKAGRHPEETDPSLRNDELERVRRNLETQSQAIKKILHEFRKAGQKNP